MRSYYAYVRTTDNQFLSCSVYGDGDWDAMAEKAYAEFARRGTPLPRGDMIASMRFVPDPRNAEPTPGVALPMDRKPRRKLSYAPR